MATEPSPASPSPTFGALLQRHRLAAGLSQEALAERAGVSARAVSDLERGQRQAPYPHTVQQLAKALRLGADDRARLQAAVPLRRGPHGLVSAEPRPTTNLPEQVTSFVGRERELAEVRELLGRTRLLTLTGPGGVGKTRLALEAARAEQDDYPDGVWLVELAALADAELVPQAVASVLGVRDQPGQPLLETLVNACARRRLLLVLDNCEHLVDACARLAAALLRGSAGVRVLAVSREALTVAGEVAWPAPPLALPDLERLPALDELARCDAVRLFAERAVAVRPSFALTAHNAPAVARLCVQLDGIPLALELAAVRVKGLPPEELAARLDQRFRLLTAGSRAALPRQQTLRATVDWSHALLSGPERALLRRLAVFAGGWTVAAAEHVCAGDGIAGDDALDLLLRLVDKSLVVAEERAGEPRYRLLQTVRQYAWERLAEAGEEIATRERHRDWCLALAEQAEPALHGPEQIAWLDRLEVEHDNLRAALVWSLDGGDARSMAGADAGVEVGLRMAGAVSWFWYLRHKREGLTWLERLLARSQGTATAARARALCAAGLVRRELGKDGGQAGRALLEESVALHRALGDKRGLAYALVHASQMPGPDYAYDLAGVAEALCLARDVGDPWLIAHALIYNGCAAYWTPPGEPARGRALLEEGLARMQGLGDTLMIAMAHRCLGRMLFDEGDYERARTAFAAGLAGTRALGDAGGMSDCLLNLAAIARLHGDWAGAVALYREVLALLQSGAEFGNRWRLLDGLASAMARQPMESAERAETRVASDRIDPPPGVFPRVARLLGAAEAAWLASGISLRAIERFGHAATVAATRAALGEDAFAAAWAEGQAMTPEEAADYALADAADGRALPSAAGSNPDRDSRARSACGDGRSR
jgi:non-specific serine/threonine protein kinase